MLYYFDPTQTEFVINDTSYLMNEVSFGTVIPCDRGEVHENVNLFLSKSLKISILWVNMWGLQPSYNFKTT